MRSFFKAIGGFLLGLYFTGLLYIIVGALTTGFVLGFFYPIVFQITLFAFKVLLILVFVDILILFANKRGIIAQRNTPAKLSNGDENPITILVENLYIFPVRVNIIDELPYQFQVRDFSVSCWLQSGEIKAHQYNLRPTERGEYHFGVINVHTKSILGLVSRRFKLAEKQMLPVYPSFIQMRKYELLAISNTLVNAGIKKIRRVGNTSEFDQIKDYTAGDDIRTLNWKATARRNKLMVNKYQEEKSQSVYALIDMGRSMQMPFEQMTLLDYAINSALVITNIAHIKHDKPGLITFSKNIHNFVPAERRGSQMWRIQETLYNQQTDFSESGYEQLYGHLKSKVNQRSLLLLFTNFETIGGLKRQIKHLRQIAKNHLLVVIFFENTELKKYLETPAKNTMDIYYKTIAQKFTYEKRMITKELQAYGIQSVYTTPENLSVNTINKYLELKSRGLV